MNKSLIKRGKFITHNSFPPTLSGFERRYSGRQVRMLSTPTQLLRLSQGQLNTLERCPRLFQHTYLEQLNSPADPEQEEKQILGSRFHLLMQQREMDLPIDSFLEADSQLQKLMAGFTNAAPEILNQAAKDEIFRESEHYRTLRVQNYLLTVIYDLLIADSQQAQILDWKTYPKPPNKRNLEQNWQTRLYTYVLAETSDYLPENISLAYWFVQSQEKPQSIKFSYNSAAHQKTADKLNQLLTQLTDWLESYHHQGNQFPQVLENSKICEKCQFARRCQRLGVTSEDISAPKSFSLGVDTNLLNPASIQEVTL